MITLGGFTVGRFTLISLLLLLLFFAVESIPALRASGRKGKGEFVSTFLLVLCSIIWVVSFVDATRLHSTSLGGSPTVRALGLVILFSGIFVRGISFLTLGRHYNYMITIEPDHELVTRGIYGLVRHPLYLGTVLVFLGFPLANDSLAGLLLFFLLCVPSVWFRIHVEERLLHEAFPSSYAAYCKKTKRLLPFTW
ncbi:isoprenylcysteine carboxylmethyltransferase family protein [Myxococcota bacterium]|nr:isoprenylcysteine carboxylmethyltransferase family protein [Myxococcota bacterium]MBU1536906.1 isoprenylcysteine carboxylmethyltransferase family protein [Myxococcota bacterium]